MNKAGKKIVYLLLFFILVFAFFLRLPQLNFPSIGYHNMKENEYISIARNMEKTGDYIRRNVSFYHAFDNYNVKKETMSLYPQVPFVSYQIILGDKLLGEQLWFPRLINIMFFLGAVIILYLVAIKLNGGYIYSLCVAFLVSVLPLGVFFSRNLQPESGAFFFMIAGTLFFLKFFEKFNRKSLILSGICILFVFAYKMTFLFALVPVIFVFPFRRYIAVRRRLSGIICDGLILSLPVVLLVVFWFITNQLQIRESVDNRVDLLTLWKLDYWRQYGSLIWKYTARENYGLPVFTLFTGGVVLAWVGYFRDKTILANYIRGCSIVVAIYFFIFSDYLNQHSYYQFPFLAFVSLASVYCLYKITEIILRRYSKYIQRVVFSILFFLSLAVSFYPFCQAIIAIYLTFFPGQDVVGEYIKNRIGDDEKFFINTHCQGYGVCVYADRKCGWVDNIDRFKFVEEKEKIKYIVVSPLSYLNYINDELKHYILSEYSIQMVGSIREDDKFYPQIAVLKKGGKFDVRAFFRYNRRPRLEKIYKTAIFQIPFYVLEDEKQYKNE